MWCFLLIVFIWKQHIDVHVVKFEVSDFWQIHLENPEASAFLWLKIFQNDQKSYPECINFIYTSSAGICTRVVVSLFFLSLFHGDIVIIKPKIIVYGI